jgi:thymidylate synthase (FAD)
MVRHRTASLNEISGRYSVMKDDFYVPPAEDVALQSTDNKQGRLAEAPDPALAAEVRGTLAAGQEAAYRDYTALIGRGLARELARINLPLSLYTEWYWEMDLHNLFHFLELRMDSHAQLEIRRYAEVMFGITRKVAPRCCESFERHRLGSVTFSREEAAELRGRLRGEPSALSGKALDRFEEKLSSGRQL